MAGTRKKRARRAAADAIPPPEPRPPSNGRARRAGRESAAPEPTNDPATELTFTQWRERLTRTELIVEEIIKLMSTGRYIPGFTHRDLAEKFDCSPDRILHLASEASRAVRRAVRHGVDFEEECRAECLTTFRAIRALAMAHATTPGARNVGSCLMAATHATRLFGFYTGIEPARKTEDVTPTHDPFDGWTREEAEHYAATGEEPARLHQPVSGPAELGLGPGLSGGGERLH
jgi:hypothetical protein